MPITLIRPAATTASADLPCVCGADGNDDTNPAVADLRCVCGAL